MRYSPAFVTTLMLLSAPAAAQISGRADLSVGGRYVWHGVSRAGGLVAQPSLALGLRVRAVSLEGGAVFHCELDRVSPGELTETGSGGSCRGEHDFWGRATLTLGPARLRTGLVRYVFLDPARSTTEVYAGFTMTGRYTQTYEAWWDVDRVRGAFLRASVDLPVLAWPFPPAAFVFVEGDVGLNVGQGPNAARPSDLANFAARGVTHVGLGAGAEVRAGRLGSIGWATLGAGVRSQINLDEATRGDGVGRNRDFLVWLWTGMTVVLGGDARSLR
jgi:hypothetical protein